jgi:hypothetical protein
LSQREGYKATLEWGFWKYVKYILLTVIVVWFTSWAVTRFTNLDLILWEWLVAIHLANLWLFIPEGVVIAGVVAIGVWEYKRKKKTSLKEQDRLNFLRR